MTPPEAPQLHQPHQPLPSASPLYTQTPSPPKPPQAASTSLGPSPRQRKNLMSLKSKLKLKLTGLEDCNTNSNSSRPTHPSWNGLSPTARSAAAASAQNRFAHGYTTTMPSRSTPLLRSHGSMIEMMKKSPVLVAVRIRPLSTAEVARGEKIALRVTSKSTLALDLPPTTNSNDTTPHRSHQPRQQRLFSFDSCVHPGATQKETYMCTGHLLLTKVLKGINACLFCYGATGSGKTHTLIGGASHSTHGRGVLLEFTDELFQKVEQQEAHISSTVTVSVCEIYREKLRDLLDTSRKPKINGGSGNSSVRMANVHIEEIQSSLEMESVLWEGLKNRVVKATDANTRSSRSHAVIHLYIEQRDARDGSMLRSKMIFVDLAGSERQEKSNAAGQRLKEAASINKSLSALGQFFCGCVFWRQVHTDIFLLLFSILSRFLFFAID